MDKKFAIFNTATNQFSGFVYDDATDAKLNARALNLALKPQFQNYTVATIIFDPEV